jgi:hypothetical protein
MLMERESTEGGRGREEILVLDQRELGKSDWPGPLLCVLLPLAGCSFSLRRPLGPLLYLREVARSCTQHCLTSSARGPGAVPLATHRPPFPTVDRPAAWQRPPSAKFPARRSTHVLLRPKLKSPLGSEECANHSWLHTKRSNQSPTPRGKAIPRVAMIGPLARPHC